MDYDNNNGNPWASLGIEERSPQKDMFLASKIIDNRFPNNFKKFSSIVTCNICQILLLKSQTLHHFKTLHNKKISKKHCKFIIPYNAIEIYDWICEHKTRQLLTKSTNNCSKISEILELKRKKFHIEDEKEPKELVISKLSKSSKAELSLKVEESQSEINKIAIETQIKFDLGGEVPQIVVKQISQSPMSPDLPKNQNEGENIVKPMDLKLNIKVNSNGLFTSSMKIESNIFDRMSKLCDQSQDEKIDAHQNIPTKGALKQVGFDKSMGCAIFSDEHNNSILIDNDKDDFDEIGCNQELNSKSTMSYPLTIIPTNSNCGPVEMTKKPTNFSSVVPPLVTAYQFSGTRHEPVKRIKPSSSATMVVTRNTTRNIKNNINDNANNLSVQKSNVKHRFYVSGHSNRNLINSMRNYSETSGAHQRCDRFLSNTTNGNLCDLQPNVVLHNIHSENMEFMNFENNSFSGTNCQQNTTNLSAYDDRDISSNPINTYEIRNELHPHMYSKKLKCSSNFSIHSAKYNQINPTSTISDNPIPSYNPKSSGIEGYIQSDLIGSPGIMIDYPYPDRNQMSFQQRLLERGVISQRDIVRSQRCLSLNNHTLIRKNVKSYFNKQPFMDCKRIFSNKSNSFTNQILSHNGNEIGLSQYNTNKNNFTFVDPLLIDSQKNKPTLLMELCLSQNNQSSATIVIDSKSGSNKILTHFENQTETFIPNYKFQKGSPLIHISNTTFKTGVQNHMNNETITFSQPLTRKYVNHANNNGISRYNGCTINFSNHSSSVIQSNVNR